ncbi:MAG TPA: hypothetical protein VMJ72_00605 [Candidatus Paceibacterota bacterium]|nr:hypothetical protein [Candidatus Paceibacterota bacterium]
MKFLKSKEFWIALACLVLPACAMALLPFLGALWVAVGAVVLWPVASLVSGDGLPLFYWLWLAFYLATCSVIWLVVRWARRG